MKLPAELNAVKTYLRENFKRHPYLYSSSTIAAGSACSMASEKYSSRVGRKTLKVYEKTGQIFEIKQKLLSAWKYAKISLTRQQLLGTCVSCSVTCYRLCKPPNCPGINSKDESTHCCNKGKKIWWEASLRSFLLWIVDQYSVKYRWLTDVALDRYICRQSNDYFPIRIFPTYFKQDVWKLNGFYGILLQHFIL